MRIFIGEKHSNAVGLTHWTFIFFSSIFTVEQCAIWSVIIFLCVGNTRHYWKKKTVSPYFGVYLDQCVVNIKYFNQYIWRREKSLISNWSWNFNVLWSADDIFFEYQRSNTQRVNMLKYFSPTHGTVLSKWSKNFSDKTRGSKRNALFRIIILRQIWFFRYCLTFLFVFYCSWLICLGWSGPQALWEKTRLKSSVMKIHMWKKESSKLI